MSEIKSQQKALTQELKNRRVRKKVPESAESEFMNNDLWNRAGLVVAGTAAAYAVHR